MLVERNEFPEFSTKTSRVDGKNGKFISSKLSPGAGSTRSYHDVMDVIIIGDIESQEINESSDDDDRRLGLWC